METRSAIEVDKVVNEIFLLMLIEIISWVKSLITTAALLVFQNSRASDQNDWNELDFWLVLVDLIIRCLFSDYIFLLKRTTTMVIID